MITMTPEYIAFLAFLIGVLFGSVGVRIFNPKHFKQCLDSGEIIVNTSNPEKDVLTLALDVSVAELMSSESVTFRVTRDES